MSKNTSIVIEENFDRSQIFRLTANFCHVDRVDIFFPGCITSKLSKLTVRIGSSIARKFAKMHEAKQVEKKLTSKYNTIESKFTSTVEV